MHAFSLARELALAMCVFPIFMLPALFGWLIPRPAALFRGRSEARVLRSPAARMSGD
jgi:hypothetical protein